MTLNRRTFVQSTAAALAASASTQLLAADVVKIGMVSPQTGPLALMGDTDKWVIEQMKTAFKDGITIGGKKHDVQILLKDSQSSPNRAGEMASDLILKDKVHLMVVSSTPETTNPVGDVCELNGIPCISTMCPWQPWFFGRKGDPAKGFVWTHHFFWGLEDVIANFTNGWKGLNTIIENHFLVKYEKKYCEYRAQKTLTTDVSNQVPISPHLLQTCVLFSRG